MMRETPLSQKRLNRTAASRNLHLSPGVRRSGLPALASSNGFRLRRDDSKERRAPAQTSLVQLVFTALLQASLDVRLSAILKGLTTPAQGCAAAALPWV